MQHKERVSPVKPQLYEYSDYRAFLRDFYRMKKSASPLSFSFRIFSQRAGLKSPNYLKMVMDGTRNLSGAMTSRFAEALKLTSRQKSFFEVLVGFSQAKNPEQRKTFFDRMLEFREFHRAHHLLSEQMELLSNWHYVAIREMVQLVDFAEDPQKISRGLFDSVGPKEVAQAIRVLLRLKLLKRNAKKKLELSEEHLSTPEHLTEVTAFHFHRQMLELAHKALNLSSDRRFVSSLTFPLASSYLKPLQDKIFDFLGELQTWLSTLESKGEEIQQLNFQLFPLTRWKEREIK